MLGLSYIVMTFLEISPSDTHHPIWPIDYTFQEKTHKNVEFGKEHIKNHALTRRIPVNVFFFTSQFNCCPVILINHGRIMN